jgi:hypothetical protein
MMAMVGLMSAFETGGKQKKALFLGPGERKQEGF